MSDKKMRNTKIGKSGATALRIIKTPLVRGPLKTAVPGTVYLLDGKPRGAAKKPRVLTKEEIRTALAVGIKASSIGVTPYMKQAAEAYKRLVIQPVED